MTVHTDWTLYRIRSPVFENPSTNEREGMLWNCLSCRLCHSCSCSTGCKQSLCVSMCHQKQSWTWWHKPSPLLTHLKDSGFVGRINHDAFWPTLDHRHSQKLQCKHTTEVWTLTAKSNKKENSSLKNNHKQHIKLDGVMCAKRNRNVSNMFGSGAHLLTVRFLGTVFWLLRGHDADYVSGLYQCGAHKSLIRNY